MKFRHDFGTYEGDEVMFTFSFSTQLLRRLGESVIGPFVPPKEAALDLLLNRQGVEWRRESAYKSHLTSAEMAAVEQVCKEIVYAVEGRVHGHVAEVSRD